MTEDSSMKFKRMQSKLHKIANFMSPDDIHKGEVRVVNGAFERAVAYM